MSSFSFLPQALVNSTITANMNFTKTSPKFGQWSDHRANTVYGLGFSSEKDLERVRGRVGHRCRQARVGRVQTILLAMGALATFQ